MLVHQPLPAPSLAPSYSLLDDSDVPLLVAHSTSYGTLTDGESDCGPITPDRATTDFTRKAVDTKPVDEACDTEDSELHIVIPMQALSCSDVIRQLSEEQDPGYEAEGEEWRGRRAERDSKKLKRPSVADAESMLLSRRRQRAATLRSSPVVRTPTPGTPKLSSSSSFPAAQPDASKLEGLFSTSSPICQVAETADWSALPSVPGSPVLSVRRSLQSLTPLTPVLPSTPKFSNTPNTPSTPRLAAVALPADDAVSPLELPTAVFKHPFRFDRRARPPRRLSIPKPLDHTRLPVPPSLVNSPHLRAFGIFDDQPAPPSNSAIGLGRPPTRPVTPFRRYLAENDCTPRAVSYGPPSPTRESIGSVFKSRPRDERGFNPYFAGTEL